MEKPPSPPPAASAQAQLQPSHHLLANFRQDLRQHAPFAQMQDAEVDDFLSHCEQQYFAPGELVIGPESGSVQSLYYVRQGAVTGTRGLADTVGAFEYEAGDLFPVSAAWAGRAVTATYRANTDTFVLVLGVDHMHRLAGRSPAFAQYLGQRTAQFLALSRQALQAAYATHAAAEQSLETPLGALVGKKLVSCDASTPLHTALQTMHQQRLGSMLVVDTAQHPVGILTRYDVLGRVALAQLPLHTPIAEVMVRPVRTLTSEHSAQDAALLMSRHGIRHVPITRDGVAIGMVSERDLFAMQRQSLKSVSTALRSATDVEALQASAQDIRRLARSLLAQGVHARQLTSMISHLNDVLTERLVQLKAEEFGIDLQWLCWLCLGSEGRAEQTIATDQDNAIILNNDVSDESREAIRHFAHAVNLALDACGYPLCRGGIMAGESACCLKLDEWRERFGHWVAQGSPQDLLNASIYFDFRPLCGDVALAQALRADVTLAARNSPRFLKMLAHNALGRSVPLNWRGAIDADEHGALDLKLQGTALFVDAARIYSLALGVHETNTRLRLEAAGAQWRLPETETGAWVGGFEFLQILRLRVQLEAHGPGAGNAAPPNRIVVNQLNDIDRRILRESFRVARQLQQRLQLDYDR